MSKIYVQHFPVVWQTSASLASSGSLGSASIICNGYSRLVGIAIASGSGKDSASAIYIKQSADSGVNWDFTTSCALSACSGSAFSVEIVGNAVQVEYRGDTTASTTAFRTLWQLRPV